MSKEDRGERHDQEAETAPKQEFNPPVILEADAREQEFSRRENEIAGAYDSWAAEEMRKSILGREGWKDAPSDKAKEIVGELLDLMSREDPDRAGQALDKIGMASAKDYTTQLNDPESGIATMAEVAKDVLAGARAQALEERRKTRFPAKKALADVRQLLIRDIEQLTGLHLPTPEERAARKEKSRLDSEASSETERKARVEKAVDFLAGNERVQEQFRLVRNETLGHGIEESKAARREFARELIEDMIPEIGETDENIGALDDELQKGIKSLLDRGGASDREREEWKNLLIDATAEDLRKLIISTKPSRKGGGVTPEKAVESLMRSLLRDINDPAAMKRKKKGPWDKK